MFNYISALLNLLSLIALSGVLCSNYQLRRLLSTTTSRLGDTIFSNNNHIISLKNQIRDYENRLEENNHVIKRLEENQETNLKQISLLKAHIQRLNKQLENNENIGR